MSDALTGQTVELYYRDWVDGAWREELCFKGWVIRPQFTLQTRILDCECSDRQQEIVEAMDVAAIDALVGGLWSADVFEPVEGRSRWDYAMERMSTQAASLQCSVEGDLQVTPWAAGEAAFLIPAGAVLASQAVGDISPAAELAAALMGGTLAAGSHAVKAGSRVMINTSPEPFSNWVASLGEDALVIGGLWAALHHPLVFLVGLVVFVLLAIWLLPKIWRGLKTLFAFLARPFRGQARAPATAPTAPPSDGPSPSGPRPS